MSAFESERGHALARELAALRVDDVLAPEDEAWLVDHLDFCDACAAVAAEYDAQHELFADALAWMPEPPRDLWARTSAAIDAEAGRRGRTRDRRRPASRPLPLRLSLAPLAAVVAVAVVVGAALLNQNPIAPGGIAASPTPIALADAADVQVITRDSAGNLQILSRPLDQVCPVGVASCGAQPTFAVTSVSGVMSATTLQGAVSPTGDKMVVVAGDSGADGVYIIPVAPKASATPSRSAVPVATPIASASARATATASSAPQVTASPSAAPASPGASESPAETGGASPEAPSPPQESASISASSPSAPTASETTPADTSPPPVAAIKIAGNINVVGVPVYAPDGQQVAFSAMPSDGSAGPDIYVWTAGDILAHAVTADHNSWLAAWTADGILLSRAVGGLPQTALLNLATGEASDVGGPGSWLPELSPDGRTAAWWAGTVKLAADGVTWVPDSGALVVGAWPATAADPTKTLATSPLAAWRVRWADDGSAIAVWTNTGGTESDGRLSLYRVVPAATPTSPASGAPEVAVSAPAPVTPPSDAVSASPAETIGSASPALPSPSVVSGSPDLANPMLDRAPANPDFSLRPGRLVWTTPSPTKPEMVEVLAWAGTEIGRLEIPADGSGTVLP